jgi:hypothetical protein
MCFEFEALYWAKLAEEEEKKKLAEKERLASHQPAPADKQQDPVPA